jgi:hypothetical protein
MRNDTANELIMQAEQYTIMTLASHLTTRGPPILFCISSDLVGVQLHSFTIQKVFRTSEEGFMPDIQVRRTYMIHA